MKRIAAAFLASTALCAPACGQTAVPADSDKADVGISGCGIYAFAGINGFGCYDGTSARPRSVPVHPFEIPSAMGDFTAGGGTSGFVPRFVGKVMAAKYLTDLTCATDQTANINAAIMATGNAGTIEWPKGCIRVSNAAGLMYLPGQHWHGAGVGFETSDGFYSPLNANGSPNYAGESANASVSGTHIAFDQVTGAAITLVGDSAKLDHIWLTDAQVGASFTGSISVSNGVATLNVSSAGTITGTIQPSQVLSSVNPGVVPDMVIGSGGTGTGGAGTYPLTSIAGSISVVAQAAVSSEAMSTVPGSTAVVLGEKQEPDGTQAVNPAGQTVDTIRVEGFGTSVDVQSGQFWTVANSGLHGPGLYGIRARNFNYPDSGDGTVSNDVIYSHGIDGVRYEFGGGLKMLSTKILGGPHAFELAVPDSLIYTVRGASSPTVTQVNTSDIFIPLTNSFENQTAGAVVLGCNGPNGAANPNALTTNSDGSARAIGGVFNGLVFDMQLAAPPNGQAASGFVSNGCVQGADVGGGYGGFGSGAININGGSGYNIHPRGMNGLTGPGLTIAAGILNTTVPYIPPVNFNKSQGSGYYNVTDNRATTDGLIVREDTRYVTVDQGSNYTYLYALGIPTFRGARATVEVEGLVQGVGQINAFLRRTTQQHWRRRSGSRDNRVGGSKQRHRNYFC